MPAGVKSSALELLAGEASPPALKRSPGEQPAGGEQERLQSWFRDYFDLLWRLARRLGVPHAQVDDVVQEAFITAERRAAEISAGSERRFLVNTTIKLSANCRRRQSTRERWLEPLRRHTEPPPDAVQLLADKQLRLALEQVLEELPGDQRAVFVLYEIEGFSVPEIADSMELPVGTVASRLGRGRNRFTRAVARLRARDAKQ
jgi:RNA polymerase sigma-70 factor (ECF subfamily)